MRLRYLNGVFQPCLIFMYQKCQGSINITPIAIPIRGTCHWIAVVVAVVMGNWVCINVFNIVTIMARRGIVLVGGVAVATTTPVVDFQACLHREKFYSPQSHKHLYRLELIQHLVGEPFLARFKQILFRRNKPRTKLEKSGHHLLHSHSALPYWFPSVTNVVFF